MDPITCCLLGICCPPAPFEKQVERIKEMLIERGVVKSDADAQRTAEFMVREVDRIKEFIKERS